MDAFRNYNTLYSGLQAADQAKESAVRTLADTKAKSDSMAKTLGEVKSFLSGQHGGREFVSKVKPILKKRAERYAEQAKAELRTKAENLRQQILEKAKQAKSEVQQRLESAKQDVTDRISGNPKPRPAQDENPTEDPQTELNEGAEAEADTDAGYDSWDVPATKGWDEEFDKWDSPWSGDTLDEARSGTFSNPIANTRANVQNPTQQDSQSPLQERPSNNSDGFERDDDYGFEKDDPESATGDPTVKDSSSTDLKGTGDASDTAAQEELDKQLADKMAKEAAEKTAASAAEEAGGEAAAGILDAIPGLDVLGIIGGAILAGTEARKQKKEEDIEEEGAMAIPTQAVQVGIGGE